jgi:Asp/Glu/hydantoin racemase
MHKNVALLHTSFVFFERERLLFDTFEELLPEVDLVNIVDDKMLSEVMEKGAISTNVIRRMCMYVLAADAMEVDAIFSTCSSLGPAVDVARQLVSTPVVKIDEGMAEKAAKEGKKIGVLATVPTTLKPTIDLIKEKGVILKKKLETKDALCEGAFELLMQNEIERHDDMVSQKAKEVSQWADTLVLAQCSMARLAQRLSNEVGLPVLSSPRLGVAHLKTILK